MPKKKVLQKTREKETQVNQYLLQTSTLDIIPLIISMIAGLILSMLIGWHFNRFGSTLSNRSELSKVFPLISLTVLLIIAIVKSSLALSLGLVGALSIVRFRTPVKEPEELAYIFLTIAVGIGLGAGQLLATVLATIFILVSIKYIRSKSVLANEVGLFLSFAWDRGDTKMENILNELQQLLNEKIDSADLRRYNENEKKVEALYYIDVKSIELVGEIIDGLAKKFPRAEVTFLDQKNVSGF